MQELLQLLMVVNGNINIAPNGTGEVQSGGSAVKKLQA